MTPARSRARPATPRGRGALLRARLRTIAALLAFAAAAVGLAQEPASEGADDAFLGRITVEREDGDVVIVNRGDFAQGARALPFIGGCEEGVQLLTYYGPERRVETILDDETRVTSSAVIVRSPEEDESEEADGEAAGETGGGGSDDDLAWYDAAVAFAQGRPCPEEITPVAAPQVTLEQGRTTVYGSEMTLPGGSDVAAMTGPIDLLRAAEGDAEELTADADALQYDRATERATLTGNVTVRSGERVSEADELELNELEGTALLRGSPARSVEGEDTVEGDTLIYYLDSNAVEVVGRVRGTLTLPD